VNKLDLARLRGLCTVANKHRDAMHAEITTCLEEKSIGALAELARRATDNEFRRTQDMAALLDEIERLARLADEALSIAHNRTTQLGSGAYGRINQIREEMKR